MKIKLLLVRQISKRRTAGLFPVLPVQTFLSHPETYLDEARFRNGGYVLTGRDGFGDVGYLLADFPLPASMASIPSKVNSDDMTLGVDPAEGAGA